MKWRPSGGQLVAVGASLAAYAGLAYATPRPQFSQLIGLFLLAFGSYAWLLTRPLPLRYGLLLALVARLLWLPAVPALSDDYFRFRWDGTLVAAGQNPYLTRPDELLTSSQPATTPAAEATQQLYPKLNSPRYYSVYPPVCQLVFGGAAWLFPRSETGFIVVLRLVLLAAEITTALLLLALLRHFELPAQRVLHYLLNPLVVVELVGNLHFEALMICGLLAALLALVKGRHLLSAGALAGAVAAKFLPLLLLPLLVRRLGTWAFLRYGAALLGFLLLLFGPFLSAPAVARVTSSLDLYFHKFEFNASLYYLLRAVGYWYSGYNQIASIGTGLAAATVVVVLAVVGAEKQPTWSSLPLALLVLLTGYFALATTVHPWYLTSLVALSGLTRFRYPLVWSALIPLSYAAYQTSAYSENLALLAVEYAVVVAVLLWELRRYGRPI